MTEQRIQKIENFIGIYDNYILKQECENAIKFFENEKKFRNTLTRLEFEGSDNLTKKDTQFFANSTNVDVWWSHLKTLIKNFEMAFHHYLIHTGAAKIYGEDTAFHFTTLKIQKTLPTEGYHVWHIEHGESYEDSTRAFVYSIYLNDMEDGGETEFLNFSKRVKPKTGRIVIWPAGFPYVHRGNPPLSGEKYIITSWMKLKP